MNKLLSLYQFFWMLESHYQQRLAWDDAAEARIARERAEVLAAAQLQAMLDANPSGSSGFRHSITMTLCERQACYEQSREALAV